MEIAINARVLNERRGGPYRYMYNILRELMQIDKKNTYHLLLYDKFEFDIKIPDNFKLHIYRFRSKLFFDYILLPFYSYIHKTDAFLFPKNTFSPLIKGNKITVYNDIIYFEKMNFREFKLFDNLHHKIMIPIAARLSKVHMTISDFTASRMIELLNINNRKIRTIKPGIEERFKVITDRKKLKKVADKYNIKLPFIFYAGSLSPRKNMLGVLKAFNKVKNKIKHNIYYTGGYSWRDNEIFGYIKENSLQSRILKLGFLDDDELVAMYNLADCYVFPSKYEGFGLPILEAQACGCPVITSNENACIEAAGDGALLVNPDSTEEISCAILKIISDKKTREQIIRKGFVNIKKYSWQNAAQKLKDLFEEAYS